jgi:hypothetical protein
MWKKYCTAGQAADGNIIRRMRIACCKPKTTDPHSEYVILIAFPLQQWFAGTRLNVTLQYTVSVCLSCVLFVKNSARLACSSTCNTAPSSAPRRLCIHVTNGTIQCAQKTMYSRNQWYHPVRPEDYVFT